MDVGEGQFDGYYVIVPVWGAEYVRLFLEYGLPSQLSPANLPAIAHLGCRYHILTHAEDVEAIQQSATVEQLQKIATVIVEPFEDEDVWVGRGNVPKGYNNALHRQTWCYQHGIEGSRHLNVAYLFLTPDSMWADGCFATAEEARQRGKRAVMITGLRCNKVTALPVFETYRCAGSAGRCTMNIPPRDLVAITLLHLQPTMVGMMMNIGIGHRCQNFHIWCIPGEGLLLRGFHPHPMMVWPVNKSANIEVTVDYQYAQLACASYDQIEMITDSDRGFIVDLADIYHTTHFVMLRERTPRQDVEFLVYCTDEFHRWSARHDIVLKTREITPERWATARAEAASFIDSLLVRFEQQRGEFTTNKSKPDLESDSLAGDASQQVAEKSGHTGLIGMARRRLRPIKRIIRKGLRLAVRIVFFPIYRQFAQLRAELNETRALAISACAGWQVLSDMHHRINYLQGLIDYHLTEGAEVGYLADLLRTNGMLLHVYWTLTYGSTFERCGGSGREHAADDSNRPMRLAS